MTADLRAFMEVLLGQRLVGIVSALGFGALAGILWIYVFGDNPWPAAAEQAIERLAQRLTELVRTAALHRGGLQQGLDAVHHLLPHLPPEFGSLFLAAAVHQHRNLLAGEVGRITRKCRQICAIGVFGSFLTGVFAEYDQIDQGVGTQPISAMY